MSAVVSDTSPIRALDHLELTLLLKHLYGEVLIPPGVVEEPRDPNSALPPWSGRGFPACESKHPPTSTW